MQLNIIIIKQLKLQLNSNEAYQVDEFTEIYLQF